MRIIFLSLICFYSYAQIPVLSVVSKSKVSTVPQDSVATPYPFFSNSITTDSINLTWVDVGADTYVLESADNKTFSSGLTTEYSGSGTDYVLDGLSANTKKYFRLHAEKSGFANSEYVIDSATTFPFTPIAYYDFRGLDNKTNIYADKYSSDIFSYNYIKSAINTSGPTLTTVGTRGGINYVAQNWTAYPKYSHNALHSPSSSFVFGDFEINWQLIYTTATGTSNIISNSGNTDRIRIASTSQILFFANNIAATINLDNAFELNKLYWFTFQRSGTTFTVIVRSLDGTTQTKSVTCQSASVTFNRVFVSSNTFNSSCLFLMDRPLTSTERIQAQDLPFRPPFTPSPNVTTTEVKGLTFSALSGNYISNSEFPNTVTGSYLRNKFYGFGKYQFCLLSKKFESPYYGDDLLYVINEQDNTISDSINIYHPTTSEDVHNSGGIVFWNNMAVHFEPDYHYDDNVLNGLVVTMFGKDMNFIGKKRIPLGRGLPVSTGANLQYHQAYIINNKIYLIAQEWSGGSNNNSARRIVMLVSDDEWNSWKKYQLFEQDAGVADFLYPSTAYCEDKILATIEYQYGDGTNYHKSVWIFKIDPSVSDVTVSNIEGTFTKNVYTSGPITETEANANFVMGTAYQATPSSTNSVKGSHLLYNPATGIAHCVRANGTNDGLTLDIIDVTNEVITEKAIPETIDGHTLYISTFGAGGSGVDNQPFVYVSGSNLILVAHEVNGGNYTVVRCQSSDGGDTWTYLDKISSDDTKPHIRMMPTKNWYYTDSRSIFASKDNSTYGDLFRYVISTP